MLKFKPPDSPKFATLKSKSMIDIKIPTVGELITEVTLVKWKKQNGEYVERDEVIAELESEKATFEVNAEKGGTLQTKAAEGDTLKIGDVLAQIDETAISQQPEVKSEKSEVENQVEQLQTNSGQEETPNSKQQTSINATGKGVIEMKIPAIGESITEVTLLKWVKKDGEFVQRDEVIAEMESEKATFELNAEQPGKLSTKAREGETMKIGDVVATIDTDVAVPAVQPESKAGPGSSACTNTGSGNKFFQRFESITRSCSNYCR